MTTIKNTSLINKHIEAGAKLVPFAGYNMPVKYSSLREEHMAVRNSVGVFDVSHMGEFIIEGASALDLILKVSSNDASTLAIGQAQYSCMPNENGGIVDDLIIYKLESEKYLLVVNASNIEKDWNWISKNNTMEAQMSDISDEMALIAVQGPKASQLLQFLTETNLQDVAYYHFVTASLAGIDNIIISATGYTGAGGFELYAPSEKVPKLWDAIFSINSDIEVLPAGLGARDTLRLEMGFCLYGNDIDDTTSPIEAGLSWVTKFNHDFVNATSLQEQKQNGPYRRLVAFKLKEKGIPRQGYEILNQDGEKIGVVTSGTLSPILEIGIGLGYVDVPSHKKGTEIMIQIRKKQVLAKIVKAPFV